MTQHITNADIVEKNREAIRTKTLGAMVGLAGCMYSYDRYDQIRCAIGACLTKKTMASVKGHRFNGKPVQVLVKNNILTVDDLSIARFTQRIHDDWHKKLGDMVHYDLTTVQGTPFPDFVKPRLDRLIDESLFTEWLDYIEENHIT